MYIILLPSALQPAVGFRLSNNVPPFCSIYLQLSPSSHSQHLKISFHFFSPSFPGSSSSSRPFQFLSEDPFGHPILLHSLQVTQPTYPLPPLSILLYFLIYSTLLVLDYVLLFHSPSSYLGPYIHLNIFLSKISRVCSSFFVIVHVVEVTPPQNLYPRPVEVLRGAMKNGRSGISVSSKCHTKHIKSSTDCVD